MYRLLLATSLIVLLFACGKKPPTDVVKIDNQTWQVPVTATDTGPAPAGKDKGEEIATITVPPSPVPQEIKIFKEDLNLFEQTMTNKPKISVTAKKVQETGEKQEQLISEQPPDLKVNVPEKNLFKQWSIVGSILLALLLSVAAGIYSKVKSISPIGLAKTLLSKLWPC